MHNLLKKKRCFNKSAEEKRSDNPHPKNTKGRPGQRPVRPTMCPILASATEILSHKSAIFEHQVEGWALTSQSTTRLLPPISHHGYEMLLG